MHRKSGSIIIVVLSLFSLSTGLLMPLSTVVRTNADEMIIRIGTTDHVLNLDPADAYDYFSKNILVQLTHGLMEMPINSTETVKGPIVHSYAVSADAKTYTFTLKEGIRFSDGEPFTAEAMAWNLNRSRTLNGNPGFILSDVISNVTVLDTYKLEIKLAISDSTFLQRLASTVAWPVSPESLPKDALAGTPDRIPAGLGPYKVNYWSKDAEMVLHRNEYYFGDPPKNDMVLIRFYAGPIQMLTSLKYGNIDIAQQVFDPSGMYDVIENKNLKYQTITSLGIRHTLINVDKHKDINVRRALAAAIDRTEITSTIFDIFNEPLFSQVPEVFGDWHIDAFMDGSPTIPSVAGNMTLSGYSTSNRYEIDLWYTPTRYGDTEDDVAQLIEQQLEDTGYFDVTIKSAEWASYLDQRSTMGFYLLGWWYDYPDPSNYIDPFVGTGAVIFGTNYSSPEMDGYLNTILTDPDLNNRKTATIKAQRLTAEDVPLIPLFSMPQRFTAYIRNISGMVLEPSEYIHYASILMADIPITTSSISTPASSVTTSSTSQTTSSIPTEITTSLASAPSFIGLMLIEILLLSFGALFILNILRKRR